ncbi:MAG: hypothetical protein ACM3RX_09260 [Methanococcaceae archaeon]
MKIYFLFSNVDDEFICKYIYTSENNKVISYSYDEEYIVKSEETAIKSLDHLEEVYEAKWKGKKGTRTGQLIKKDYPDVKPALYYLDGTLEDFKEEIPARKRLPQIINPYDMDFDEGSEDLTTMKDSHLDFDKDFDEDLGLGDEFKDDEEPGNYDDDDFYR